MGISFKGIFCGATSATSVPAMVTGALVAKCHVRLAVAGVDTAVPQRTSTVKACVAMRGAPFVDPKAEAW